MFSSKTTRSLLVFVPFIAGSAVVLSGCMIDFDDAAGPKGRDDFGGGTGAGAGSSSTHGGSVFQSPTMPSEPAPTFAELCGDGCMTSDEAFACAPAGMDPNGSLSSCQIVATNDGPSAQCQEAGDNGDGEPCETAASCAPGLGCVATGSGTGVCHPYCCGDVNACPESTYCAPVAMAEDAASAKPVRIPVCMPATPCTLLQDMSCPADKACTVVRGDGTTSCVDRGTGKLDEPCPCDAGYMCSTLKNKCLKLCQSGGNDCPSGMVCQGGSNGFPPNFGVCVGQHDK